MDGKKNMKKLFLICTHGDELNGLILRWKYGKEGGNYKIIIANLKALNKHKRFIDEDLNRVFNLPYKDNHERNLAKKLTKIIKEHKIVYDIHQVEGKMKPCVFINKITKEILEELRYINIKYVILDDNPQYSNHFTTSVADIGITLEYPKRFKYLIQLLKDFKNIIENKEVTVKKEFFRNFAGIKDDYSIKYKNFVPLTIEQKQKLSRYVKIDINKEYCPIFVDVYQGYKCFLLEKINNIGF